MKSLIFKSMRNFPSSLKLWLICSFSQSLLTLDLIEEILNRTPVSPETMESIEDKTEIRQWRKNTDYFRKLILDLVIHCCMILQTIFNFSLSVFN